MELINFPNLVGISDIFCHIHPLKQNQLLNIVKNLQNMDLMKYVQKLYVFGSGCTLRCWNNSDLDILVVSDVAPNGLEYLTIRDAILDCTTLKEENGIPFSDEIDALIVPSAYFESHLRYLNDVCYDAYHDGILVIKDGVLRGPHF